MIYNRDALQLLKAIDKMQQVKALKRLDIDSLQSMATELRVDNALGLNKTVLARVIVAKLREDNGK